MMKRHLVLGLVLAASMIVGVSQPAHALLELVRTDTSAESRAPERQTSEERGEVLNASRTNELEQKRQESEQRIAERKAAIAEKLSGHRAEACEQKEAKINQILANRNDAAQRHFETFKSIHERLIAFTAQKQLTVDDANALALIMDDRQLDAQIAINAAKTTIFDCSETSASQPGQIVMDLVAAEKQALKDYRTAIKDYALAVKDAANAVESSSTTETEPAQTETEATTPESAQ